MLSSEDNKRFPFYGIYKPKKKTTETRNLIKMQNTAAVGVCMFWEKRISFGGICYDSVPGHSNHIGNRVRHAE